MRSCYYFKQDNTRTSLLDDNFHASIHSFQLIEALYFQYVRELFIPQPKLIFPSIGKDFVMM